AGGGGGDADAVDGGRPGRAGRGHAARPGDRGAVPLAGAEGVRVLAFARRPRGAQPPPDRRVPRRVVEPRRDDRRRRGGAGRGLRRLPAARGVTWRLPRRGARRPRTAPPRTGLFWPVWSGRTGRRRRGR